MCRQDRFFSAVPLLAFALSQRAGSGTGSTAGTQAKSCTVTVTGTSGATQHSTTVTLTAQ